jgi:hypothetical protein
MKNAFGESTARDIRSGKAWKVGPGSSFRANKSIIHAVYDYYGGLYSRNRSKCVWAGLGRVAGGPFFWGFQFIDDWIRSIDDDPCFKVPDTWGGTAFQLFFCDPTNPSEEANVVIRANCQAAIEALMQMGRAIFEDLAWQHEAYLAGGLSEILRVATPGVIDSKDERQRECLGAWRLIDGADAFEGNRVLFRREQLYTITDGYAALRSLLGVPSIMSVLASSPHPWGQSFYDYWHATSAPLPAWGGDPKWTPKPSGQWWPQVVLTHDVTTDLERWSWMTNDIYPKWMSVDEGKRRTMVELTLEKLCAHDWPAGL